MYSSKWHTVSSRRLRQEEADWGRAGTLSHEILRMGPRSTRTSGVGATDRHVSPYTAEVHLPDGSRVFTYNSRIPSMCGGKIDVVARASDQAPDTLQLAVTPEHSRPTQLCSYPALLVDGRGSSFPRGIVVTACAETPVGGGSLGPNAFGRSPWELGKYLRKLYNYGPYAPGNQEGWETTMKHAVFKGLPVTITSVRKPSSIGQYGRGKGSLGMRDYTSRHAYGNVSTRFRHEQVGNYYSAIDDGDVCPYQIHTMTTLPRTGGFVPNALEQIVKQSRRWREGSLRGDKLQTDTLILLSGNPSGAAHTTDWVRSLAELKRRGYDTPFEFRVGQGHNSMYEYHDVFWAAIVDKGQEIPR